MITYRDGDLFASGLPALAHGVNCKGVMGAGIAAQFRQYWPGMYEAYRQSCRSARLLPGGVMRWQADDSTVIYNLATQLDPGPYAQTWMIAAAVGQMMQENFRNPVPEIGLPMIGCGIGGLHAGDLREALDPYENAPVNLTVFKYIPGITR
jgi:O-acetyl-ADP-ribose deacetylase (regulator of RNase III)